VDSLHTTEAAYWRVEAERLAGDNAHLTGGIALLEAENAALLVRVGELEGQSAHSPRRL
jgi:hypothetical protein